MFYITEALELNQQILSSQQQGSNSNSSDMFQLPPGIISGVMSPTREQAGTEHGDFTPMEESSVAHNGTGTNHSTPNLPTESFTVGTGGGVSRKNSFSLNPSNFGQETLDSVHTPTLDSKPESMYTDVDKHETSLDLNVEPYAGSSSDFPDQNIMDSSFNHLKSEEQYHLNSYDIASSVGQSHSSNNIVSQFLQNMALKTSDPMFCGSQTVMSTRGLHANNTIMTSANSQLVMAADTQKSTATTVQGSLLKEVLTCPPASLDAYGTYPIHNAASNSTTFAAKVDTPGMMDMDVQIDLLKSVIQNESEKQIQSSVSLGFHGSLKDSMEYSTSNMCQEGTETIDLTRESSPVLSCQSGTPFSPEQIVPGQPSPFSPSEVLTNYSVEQVGTQWQLDVNCWESKIFL